MPRNASVQSKPLALSPDPVRRRELCTVESIRHILDLAWRARTSKTRLSERLARTALAILRWREARRIKPRDREDLRALACAYIANSRRICGDLQTAREMLARAEQHLQSGTHSPVHRAEFLMVEASIAREHRHFAEAEDKLDQAIAIYRWSKNEKKIGLSLLTKAYLKYTADEPDESVACLEQAEKHLDLDNDPWTRFSLLQLRALYLHEVGRIQEAEDLLPEVHQLAQRAGTKLERLRVVWLEGLIRMSQHRDREAEKLLREARDAFVEEGIHTDAALVSLDLAVVFLEAGRLAETRKLAEEMLPLFESLDVRREAFAALILFHRAALQEKATTGMARDIAAFLKRTGSAPALKYEEPS